MSMRKSAGLRLTNAWPPSLSERMRCNDAEEELALSWLQVPRPSRPEGSFVRSSPGGLAEAAAAAGLRAAHTWVIWTVSALEKTTKEG